MKRLLIGFFVQDDGAVTVDWVVLSAAVLLMGLILVTPIATGTTGMSATLKAYIGTVEVGSGTTTPPPQ